MARAAAISVENDFSRGLISEATPFNFPENAFTDISDCRLEHKGIVKRRLGFDFEDTYRFSSFDEGEKYISEYVWKAAGRNGRKPLVVIQFGTVVSFYRIGANNQVSGTALYSLDLTPYKLSTSPKVALKPCQFAAGDGKLFITHPYCSSIYITYDPDTDSFTPNAINPKIRDLEGVEDGLAVDERPSTLSDEHRYNLYNQGWDPAAGNYKTLYEPLAMWERGRIPNASDTPPGNYPANSDIWWLYKQADGEWSFKIAQQTYLGTTPAPKGYYKIDPFDNTRANIRTTSGYHRPSTCAFFAGRFWMGGVDHVDYNTKIYFSRIIEKDTHISQFHQDNDPTAEENGDLLPSDGGVIVIPEMEDLICMRVVGTSLICFASNGLWAITGSQGIGFAADDYTIEKISEVDALSFSSVVSVDGLYFWWNSTGIWVLGNKNDGSLEPQSVSETTIKTWFDDIPKTELKYVKGAFNPAERRVQWLYRTTTSSNLLESMVYDRILNLDMVLQAFYPYSIDHAVVDTQGIFCTEGVYTQDIDETVVNSSEVTVVNASSNTITVDREVSTDTDYVFKYITACDSVSYVYPTDYQDFANQYVSGDPEYELKFTTETYIQDPVLSNTFWHYCYGTTDSSWLEEHGLRFFNVETLEEEQRAIFFGDATFDHADHSTANTDEFFKYYVTPLPGRNDYAFVRARVIVNTNGCREYAMLVNLSTGAFDAINDSYHEDLTVRVTTNVFIIPVTNGTLTKYYACMPWSSASGATPTYNQWTVWEVDADNLTITRQEHQSSVPWTSAQGVYQLLVGKQNTNSTDVYIQQGLSASYILEKFTMPYTYSTPSAASTYLTPTSGDYQYSPNYDADTGYLVYGYYDSSGSDYQIRAWDTVTNSQAWINTAATNLEVMHPYGFPEHYQGSNGTVFIFHDGILSDEYTINGVDYYGYVKIGCLATGSFAPILTYKYDPVTGDPLNPGSPIPILDWNVVVGRENQNNMQYAQRNFNVCTGGVTFSEEKDTNYVDWVSSGTSEDFSSYFTTGYRVKGENLRDWQSNYVGILNRTETNSSFYISGRWDWTTTSDASKWTTRQQGYVHDANRSFNRRRLKIRGNGPCLQYRVESETGKPFNIAGWSVFVTANQNP